MTACAGPSEDPSRKIGYWQRDPGDFSVYDLHPRAINYFGFPRRQSYSLRSARTETKADGDISFDS